MKAFYFSTADRVLGYGDKRPIALGTTHTVEGDIVACYNGLHGSVRPLDALEYAPGPVLWQVDITGDLDIREDKVAGRSRTYLRGGIDVSDVLNKFARMCALDVIHLWDAPPVVVQYLKTGDQSLRGAAEYAARAAAEYAARAAARAAAWDAAWAAVWAAAWAAAQATAWYVARAKQHKRLHRLLMDEIRRQERA